MSEVSIRKAVRACEGGVQAAKAIDLEIADHELVLLVGPSGCGKSTTLRLADGTRLPVPPQRLERYAAGKDRPVTLGLRPEHLTETSGHEKPGVVPMKASIDVVEPMGMETLLHFFIDGEPVCARVDPATEVRHDQVMTLAVDLNHMHLIDRESGWVV